MANIVDKNSPNTPNTIHAVTRNPCNGSRTDGQVGNKEGGKKKKKLSRWTWDNETNTSTFQYSDDTGHRVLPAQIFVSDMDLFISEKGQADLADAAEVV